MLLHQLILVLTGAQQGSIRCFEIGLELLPSLQVSLGLGIPFLAGELLEFGFQWSEGGLEYVQPLTAADFGVSKGLEALVPLFAAFHEGAMGPARSIAFGV